MARQDNLKILTSISCPTLVVCGEEDVLTPPEIHREMAENIPNARLELIPGCGHLTPLEAPERLNDLMAGKGITVGLIPENFKFSLLK